MKLTTDIHRLSKNDLTPYYNDMNDHIEKIVETLEEAKEAVELKISKLQDEVDCIITYKCHNVQQIMKH